MTKTRDEVVKPIADAEWRGVVEKLVGALKTCSEDYVFNGEDEIYTLTYDEDKVKEALAQAEQLMGKK
jgi:hypothetical protein